MNANLNSTFKKLNERLGIKVENKRFWLTVQNECSLYLNNMFRDFSCIMIITKAFKFDPAVFLDN